ncbi:MAG: trypsin-like peptidase domain-containing protein [Planctomycetia bacterium]|nr:trypsin-like peptidase domain-containing protein [Planctomycetia bacterium]
MAKTNKLEKIDLLAKVDKQEERDKNREAEKTEVVKETEKRPRLVIAAAEPDAVVRASLKPEAPSTEERENLRKELAEQSKILQAQANVLKIVSKIIEPSVVHIKADMTKRGPRGERINFHDEGSGIIISRNEKFYILTNHHVIRESLPENIVVQLYDNRITHPIHVWFDVETDIAVLEMREMDLIPATLGDSNAMDIGDFVLAVGSPFGLDRSVTFGIISAKGRRAINLDANVNLQDFIQTDAAINPGNSGGPLVNLQAEVIAMNTAIASSSGANAGIAFSIPIRMVMLIADQLIMYGKARRAYLGVTLDSNFTATQAKSYGFEKAQGARVVEVQPDSPAARANFAVGDIILKFNNASVEDEKHLYNLVNLADINNEIPVTVFRNGKVYKINIKLLER